MDRTAEINRIANRQIKHRLTNEQALAELAAMGILIDAAEYSAIQHAKRHGAGKARRQAATTARLDAQRAAVANQAARDARNWPGMSDEQVGAEEARIMAEIGAALIARGAAKIGDSPLSESVYYSLGGRKVRVSCHTLPDSMERAIAAERSDEVHITIRRPLSAEQIREIVESI